MKLPNFLIIGAQKAGTTTLYNALNQHPEIYMPGLDLDYIPDVKEINFYFKENLFKRGLNYYKSLFKPTKQKIIGEASPGYMCHPLVPKRIYETNKNVKIICILRNPVDRAYSQFWDNKRHLSETGTFEDAFLKYSHYKRYEPGKIGYFTRGFYADYLQKYYDLFPSTNILVLKNEDLQNNFEDTIFKCLKFLDVKNLSFKITKIKSNQSYIYNNIIYNLFFKIPLLNKYVPYSIKRLSLFGKTSKFSYPMMDNETRRKLTSFFLNHNRSLEKLTGFNLSKWK